MLDDLVEICGFNNMPSPENWKPSDYMEEIENLSKFHIMDTLERFTRFDNFLHLHHFLETIQKIRTLRMVFKHYYPNEYIEWQEKYMDKYVICDTNFVSN